MFARHTHTRKLARNKQRGAALMVVMVIVIIGVTTLLVSALRASTLKNSRQNQTATVLIQAKEALIGRAISAPNHPGSLPCPDTSVPSSTNSGKADVLSGNNCPSNIGRLPWKTLGISDLRDGDGEGLWYAMSPTLRDSNSAQPINSDTSGSLAVTGNLVLNNVAAIVFSPGAPQCGQSHSNNTISNFLESVSTPTPITTATILKNSNNCSASPYNDTLLAITADEIFQPVEKRITHEVKACLDEYANSSGGKYPWATPISNVTTYAGVFNTLFGRVSLAGPNITTSAAADTLLSALNTLQAALDAFFANGNAANTNALINAGNAVKGLQNSVPSIPSNTIDTAGDWGIEYAAGQHTYSTVQNKIDVAIAATGDPTMSSIWTPKCVTLLSTSNPYWKDWKNMVFFQVANSYTPGATTPLSCGTACLSLTGSGHNTVGSGTYRAVVTIAGRKLGATRTTTTVSDYLEPINLLPSGNSTKPYKIYSHIDVNYQTVNDFALCLDGEVNCK